MFGQELRIAVEDRLTGIIKHPADDAGEENAFASDDDVALESTDAVGELFHIMMPAPFAVADDVNACQFLKADGEDDVFVHPFLKFSPFHSPLHTCEK